jgi:phenylpyruvate tautomerase PptA (4-oxalocrotonate tautomerase family)
MPAVLIETRRVYSPLEEAALIDATHAALREALQLPPHDRIVRLVAHQPHRFACPPGKAQPDRFTLISVDGFSGRSLAAKRLLYRAIVSNLAALGIPEDHVTIVLREAPRENWGVRGGQAGCDVDLGFTVEV